MFVFSHLLMDSFILLGVMKDYINMLLVTMVTGDEASWDVDTNSALFILIYPLLK